MEIFRAWFVWGESDLFFPGVILLLIFVLLPWREGEKKRNAILIICSVVVYWVCESVRRRPPVSPPLCRRHRPGYHLRSGHPLRLGVETGVPEIT